MTDRELLEQINSRLNTLESQLGTFIANTETNFTRVLDEFKLVHKQIDSLDRRIDFVMEELVGVKIQTNHGSTGWKRAWSN